MKTRKINRHGKSKPPRQGSNGPVFTQSPLQGGGKPNKTESPRNTAMMKNRSMKAPGSGTHGTGRGVR